MSTAPGSSNPARFILKHVFTPDFPPSARKPTENRRLSEDWIPYKEFIVEQYVKQRETLEYVRGRLEGEGFKVTLPQLKHALRAWGETQKALFTTEELEYLARTLAERERKGKKTIIRRNGTKLRLTNVKKTLRRHEIKNQRTNSSKFVPKLITIKNKLLTRPLRQVTERNEDISGAGLELQTPDPSSIASTRQGTPEICADTAVPVEKWPENGPIKLLPQTDASFEAMRTMRNFTPRTTLPSQTDCFNLARSTQGYQSSNGPGSSSFAPIPIPRDDSPIVVCQPPISKLERSGQQFRADYLTSSNFLSMIHSGAPIDPLLVGHSSLLEGHSSGSPGLSQPEAIPPFPFKPAVETAPSSESKTVSMSSIFLEYDKAEAAKRIKFLRSNFEFTDAELINTELLSLSPNERWTFTRRNQPHGYMGRVGDQYYVQPGVRTGTQDMALNPATCLEPILQLNSPGTQIDQASQKSSLESTGQHFSQRLAASVLPILQILVNDPEPQMPQTAADLSLHWRLCPCYSFAFAEKSLIASSRSIFHDVENGGSCILKAIVSEACQDDSGVRDYEYHSLSLRCWIWTFAAKALGVFPALNKSHLDDLGISPTRYCIRDILQFEEVNTTVGSRLYHYLSKTQWDDDIEHLILGLLAFSHLVACQGKSKVAISFLTAISGIYVEIFSGVEFEALCSIVDLNKLRNKMARRREYTEYDKHPASKLTHRMEVLGQLCTGSFKFEDALSHYTRAVRHEKLPASPEAAGRTRRIYRLVADAHRASGNYLMAQKYYNACLQAGCSPSEESLVRFGIGETYRALGDKGEALSHFSKALLVRGSDGNYHFSDEGVLGMAFSFAEFLIEMGLFDEGMYWLRFSLKVHKTVLGPTHPLTKKVSGLTTSVYSLYLQVLME